VEQILIFGNNAGSWRSKEIYRLTRRQDGPEKPDNHRVASNPELLLTSVKRVLRSLVPSLLITPFLVSTVLAQPPAGVSQIKHVVFILKENHTFDNYFGAFPGADGASRGKIHTGATVPLTGAPDVSLTDSAGLSWKYYGVSKGSPGYVWSPLDAIQHIRFSPQWNTNVADIAQFGTDVATDNLAAVSWITTDLDENEHPGHDQVPCVGENSRVAFLNAVMQSPAWNSTAIFVAWDDFGGFYDHVLRPQGDPWGLGPRAGLLTISPFAKSGYIEHTQLEFSSIVRFIEELYVLPFLTERDPAAMWDEFNFTGTPQVPPSLQPQTCLG